MGNAAATRAPDTMTRDVSCAVTALTRVATATMPRVVTTPASGPRNVVRARPGLTRNAVPTNKEMRRMVSRMRFTRFGSGCCLVIETLSLECEHVCVAAADCHQFLMGSVLHDASLGQNHDSIGVADTG